MVGGLEKQIKEVKEVIELPVKHPEIFEALGIAQPKVLIVSIILSSLLIFLFSYFLRESFFMVLQAQVKHS